MSSYLVPPSAVEKKVRSAGLEAGAVRGLQALRATLLTAVEAARDGELQEVRPVEFDGGYVG